jgi:hypothetical protein
MLNLLKTALPFAPIYRLLGTTDADVMQHLLQREA